MNRLNYAIVENNVVTNIIWLHPSNAAHFPEAVWCDDFPVGIGDTYKDGVFFRDGRALLTNIQYLQIEYEGMLAELDEALLEATYENILGGIEE